MCVYVHKIMRVHVCVHVWHNYVCFCPCVCVSVRVPRACVCACVCMHLYMCSAGPEAAVLDWCGPKADLGYWQGGGGGGGQVWEHPPRKNWDFKPSHAD